MRHWWLEHWHFISILRWGFLIHAKWAITQKWEPCGPKQICMSYYTLQNADIRLFLLSTIKMYPLLKIANFPSVHEYWGASTIPVQRSPWWVPPNDYWRRGRIDEKIGFSGNRKPTMLLRLDWYRSRRCCAASHWARSQNSRPPKQCISIDNNS